MLNYLRKLHLKHFTASKKWKSWLMGRYLEKDIRPDGRDMDEGRDIIIADGSCEVFILIK